MNSIKFYTRVWLSNLFIHSVNIYCTPLVSQGLEEWWVISERGPSLREFTGCCYGPAISQKPQHICVNHRRHHHHHGCHQIYCYIVLLLVAMLPTARDEPHLSVTASLSSKQTFLSWQRAVTCLYAPEFCSPIGENFSAFLKKYLFLSMEKWQFFHESCWLARFKKLNYAVWDMGKKRKKKKPVTIL